MAPLDIRHADGRFVLRLHVTPKARKRRIGGEHGGALKVSVHEPPERGKANDAVIELLAEALGLPQSAIELLAGETSRAKQVAINGFSGGASELAAALLKWTT